MRESVKHWAARWTQKFGEEPVILWPKMCGQIVGIVRHFGVVETNSLLDLMFESQDDFIRNDSDYGLGAFVGCVNKLKLNRHRGASPASADRKTQSIRAGFDQARREMATLAGGNRET